MNYEYHLKVWWDPQEHGSKNQKVILDIADMRKLHANLMIKIQQQTEQKTDAEPFKVKEKVYLRTDNIWVKDKSKKLMNKSIELFKVVWNIKKLSYELSLSQEM